MTTNTIMERAADARRVAIASGVGTTIEWYDFFIYGTAAAVVFGPQFFPRVSALAGTLAAFATFAIGFVARPLGGIVMGHFGDRVGRKAALVWCLVLMGVSTFAIGLLPNYARLGVWAPAGLGPAAADHPAVAGDDAADRRVGPHIAEPAARQRQRGAHRLEVHRFLLSRQLRGFL